MTTAAAGVVDVDAVGSVDSKELISGSEYYFADLEDYSETRRVSSYFVGTLIFLGSVEATVDSDVVMMALISDSGSIAASFLVSDFADCDFAD